MSDTSTELEIVAATEIERLARMAKIGEWGTAGPDSYPDLVHVEPPETAKWSDGLWYGAAHKAAHPGRMGGKITPWSIVFHTTDMLPNEFDALVSSWTSRAADGACAHFLIGRDESQGVVQFVPINRNGNHAGGRPPPNGHGWYVVDGHDVHPNLVAVGIEVHCAGGVRQINGAWRLVEDGSAHGMAIPPEDVILDTERPGRGFHVVTDYQRGRLRALLGDLNAIMTPVPTGATTRSTGEAVPAWAALNDPPRVVGHVNLDPTNRSDPWPPQYAFLRALRL